MANPLMHLSSTDRQVVMSMLRCIVDRSREFSNEVDFLKNRDGISFFIKDHHGGRGPHEDFTSSMTLVSQMESFELIEVVQPPPPRVDRKGRLRVPEASTFYFTPLAKQLYQNRDSIADVRTRKAIGEHMYRLYQEWPNYLLEFDADEVARASNISPERVKTQARILRDVGIFEEGGAINSSIDIGWLSFTPAGLMWAIRSFPDELIASPAVNVTVQVNIRNFIQDLRESQLSDQDKIQAEDLVIQIQEEPTMEKVARLFGLAANIQQLVPAVVRFMAENGSALSQRIPGV